MEDFFNKESAEKQKEDKDSSKNTNISRHSSTEDDLKESMSLIIEIVTIILVKMKMI